MDSHVEHPYRIFDGFAIYKFEPYLDRLPKSNILFLHGNGIAALSYKSFLQSWATLTGARIFAMDLRGFGKSQNYLSSDFQSKPEDLWKILSQDVVTIFEHLKQEHQTETWFFAGHSLGAWWAFYASAKVKLSGVLLFDPPLLSPLRAVYWYLTCTLNQRNRMPLSQTARARARMYYGADAQNTLKKIRRRSFFKGWEEDQVLNYFRANYAKRQDVWVLRHNPDWEAELFEALPHSVSKEFKDLSKTYDHSVPVFILAGEASDVCHTWRKRTFKKYFPNGFWYTVPQVGHMMMFENQKRVLQVLEAEKVLFWQK